jgi:DNA-binding transcriptional regulator LsrR (DeoR family)
MADALGLTAIHVNRVLRQLRERGLVTFREGSVVVHDLAGLRTLAEYHSGYLDQSNGFGN